MTETRLVMTAANPQLLSETQALLKRMQAGERSASDELFQLLYRQLRQLAQRELEGAPRDSTLQATALVHELWLRIRATDNLTVESRQHFLYLAARVIRGVIVDHARRRNAEKRGRARVESAADVALVAWQASNSIDPIVLDELLDRLRELDPQLADIVELRFFTGLSEEETASVLGLSRRQVQHRWRLARGWMQRYLEGMRPSGA